MGTLIACIGIQLCRIFIIPQLFPFVNTKSQKKIERDKARPTLIILGYSFSFRFLVLCDTFPGNRSFRKRTKSDKKARKLNGKRG